LLEEGFRPDESIVKVVQAQGETALSLAKALNEANAQTQQLAQQRQQELIQKDTQVFLANLDSLGHPDLFGKSGENASAEVQQNAQAIWNCAHDIAHLMQQKGIQANASDPHIIKRAAENLFAAQISQRQQQHNAQGLIAQSQEFMGTGTSGAGKPESTEWTGDSRTDPVLQKLYADMRSDGMFQ